MIKRARPANKSKAVSSYLLSGVNIKKIITEERQGQQQASVGEANIIRIGRNPIFRVHVSEAENTAQHSLPNKSFKIRSFTKKLRDPSDSQKMECSHHIFQKVEFVRNLRAINNRIESLNPSRMGNLQRERRMNESVGGSANLHSKMKEIFKRQSSMKCKIGSQIFVKEFYEFPEKPDRHFRLRFERVQTENYRVIANKVHVVYNEHFKESGRNGLLIISVEALAVSKKRITRTNISHYQEGVRNGEIPRSGMGPETAELIKMIGYTLCPKEQEGGPKVAFKVRDQGSLEWTKQILEMAECTYYCIFYPISKYTEAWNLYAIDALLDNVNQLILLETTHNLHTQFPIFPPTVQTAFIATSNDNFLTLSRNIQAIKQCLGSSSQMDQNRVDGLAGESGVDQKELEAGIAQNAFQGFEEDSGKWGHCNYALKEENIDIDLSSLEAYLKFAIESREFRTKRNKRKDNRKRQSCEMARDVLCQRETNLPENSIINLQKETSRNSSTPTLEEIYQTLIDNFKHCINDKGKLPHNYRPPEAPEQLSDISNHLLGLTLRSKPLTQHIAELVKKNTHIERQISGYLQARQGIELPERDGVRSFEQKRGCEQSEVRTSALQFKVYRIS